jgi:transketolase
MAWRIALERPDGPVALALSRQKLPTFDRAEVAPVEGALRGGYTLWQRSPGAPDAIVLATGSEVAIALAGARLVDDANVRVVSLPCWELFAAQEQAYRDEVLPPAVAARVSIEAGITFGWQAWGVTEAIGIDRFGASAPYERVYEELGLTATAVADAVRRTAA